MSGLSSERARQLASRLASVLRQEYRERCEDRRGLEELLGRWVRMTGSLPLEEASRLAAAVAPLSGYGGLPREARQGRLVAVGRALVRLSEASEGASPGASPPAPPPSPRIPTLSLKAEVHRLKGVGPHFGAMLARVGVQTLQDLLEHFPRRWEDRSRCAPIAEVRHEAMETVEGILGEVREKKPRPGLTLVSASLRDGSGALTLTWFNQPQVLRRLVAGRRYLAHGKVDRGYTVGLLNPEIELQGGPQVVTGRIVPVYPLTGKLPQGWLRRLMFWVVPTYSPQAADPLPRPLLEGQGLLTRSEALQGYHWPVSLEARDRARRRLAFDELFLLQLQVVKRRLELQADPRMHEYSKREETLPPFLELLPYAPTRAQARVFGEILDDLARDRPMNRLLQGDVGSGKTLVAAFACWAAIQNGYQAAVMAPTEILAEQHHHKLSELLEPAGVRVGRLQGSMTRKGKRHTCDLLAAHQLDLVVGTHALIQEGVEFANLGLVTVDEQHKFGVMQRTTLRQKGRNPDLLVMTATPIPRTLALTLYGDLEVSRLDELPPGRQPILSESVTSADRARVHEEIRAELRSGRQGYIICPLVEETEKVEATAAVEEAERLQREVFPEFSVGLLHGRMKGAEKEAIMEAFRRGEHHLLISTTVIEVGVDVPNATIMLVQDAHRFGLAQLHQLRGRVGRGSHASRCLFMGDASSPQTQRRLRAIARLSDGFEVAEEDLQIRGPGDFYGFRQAGFPELKVADLLRDADLLEQARRAATRILEEDPDLALPVHRLLREHLTLQEARAVEIIH